MNDPYRYPNPHRSHRRVWHAPSGLRFNVWLDPSLDPTFAQLIFVQAEKPWGYIVRSVPGDTDLQKLSDEHLERWFFGAS